MAKKIKLDPRNARSHPDRNRSAVEKLLRELGAVTVEMPEGDE